MQEAQNQIEVYYHKHDSSHYFKRKNQSIALKSQNLSKDNNLEYQIKKVQEKSGERVGTFAAVFGIINLIISSYIIAVEKSTKVGKIREFFIYQVNKVSFIPLKSQETKEDSKIIKKLKQILEGGNYYYSFYDLTNTLQHNLNHPKKKRNQFRINDIHLPIINQDIKNWFPIFICGYFQQSIVENYVITVLSRIDSRRQAYRWIRRGCNILGNSTNNSQTQCILTIQKQRQVEIFSHTQFRGLMPFLWQQYPRIQIRQKAQIVGNFQTNQKIFTQNMEEALANYKNVSIVNLINKNGTQLILGEYFAELCKSLNRKELNYHWIYFNYQMKCNRKNIKNVFRSSLSSQLQQYGYFQATNRQNNIMVNQKQKGIFRTNCMESIDRTNVGQRIVHSLIRQKWFEFSFISEQTKQKIEQIFDTMMVNNGNSICQFQCGTNTLIGKKLEGSNIVDLISNPSRMYTSVKRYFLSNFYFPIKQDYLDVLNCKLKPQALKQNKYFLINPIFIFILVLLLAPYITTLIINSLLQELSLIETVIIKFLAILGSMFVVFKIMKKFHFIFVHKIILKNPI